MVSEDFDSQTYRLLSLEISFDCERAVRVGPFHGEDQNYEIILTFLVSVIHSAAILLVYIRYNLEPFNFSFERTNFNIKRGRHVCRTLYNTKYSIS